jgi:hypothetical protein
MKSLYSIQFSTVKKKNMRDEIYVEDGMFLHLCVVLMRHVCLDACDTPIYVHRYTVNIQ